MDFLERNPAIDVVGSWARFIDEKGRYIRAFKAPCETSKVILYMSGSPELSYGCTLHPTIMIRRRCFDAAGYYDEENSGKDGPRRSPLP